MNLPNFFHINGYGWYLLVAYGCVAIFLFIQWLLPMRRWQNYLHRKKAEVSVKNTHLEAHE